MLLEFKLEREPPVYRDIQSISAVGMANRMLVAYHYEKLWLLRCPLPRQRESQKREQERRFTFNNYTVWAAINEAETGAGED